MFRKNTIYFSSVARKLRLGKVLLPSYPLHSRPLTSPPTARWSGSDANRWSSLG